MTAQFEKARDICQRIILEAVIELRSPAHLGGSDPDASSDRPLLSDADGRTYLAGTTLAGLMRAALEPYDQQAAARLFGDLCAQDNALAGEKPGKSTPGNQARQARLLFSDAHVMQGSALPVEVRDGVRIDAASAVADDKEKYDLELLPAGARFRLRFQLDLPSNQEERTPLLLGALKVFRALEEGRISLGARTTRGFGETHVVPDQEGQRWSVEEYDVRGEKSMRAWLGRGLEGLPHGWPEPIKRCCADTKALAEAWGLELPRLPCAGNTTFGLKLRVDGSLIIRSGGHDPTDADHIHLRRPELTSDGQLFEPKPVLPGTSLAGVLRHRCLRIARTLARDQAAADDLVDQSFGPAKISKERKAWASRVRVQEASIRGGRILRNTRLRIDPWTGGAVESLLFSEDLLYGGLLDLRIELCQLPTASYTRAARALLLLALRDLARGEVPVGGECGAGRGRLRPRSGEPFLSTTNPDARMYLETDGQVRLDPAGAFDADFQELRSLLGCEDRR